MSPPSRNPLWERAKAEVLDLHQGVRASWTLSLESPRADQRLRRVGHAFALPWVVLAIALRKPEIRRAYLRTTLPVTLMTLALGAFAVTSPWTRSIFHEKKPDGVRARPAFKQTQPDKGGSEDSDDIDEAARDLAEARELIAARARARKQGLPAAKGVDAASDAQDLAQAAKLIAARTGAIQHALQADGEDEADFDVEDDDEAGEAQGMAAGGDAGATQGPATQPILNAVGYHPMRFSARTDRTPAEASTAPSPIQPPTPQVVPASKKPPRPHRAQREETASPEEKGWRLPTLSALYAGLTLIEGCLLALTREHQHQIGRTLCLAAGAEPEHSQATARVRIDWPWLKKKVRRKIRGALILASGWLPVTLLAALPWIGKWLSPIAAAAWGFYWLAVFTLGASHFTWQTASPDQPIFVRACQRGRRIPLVGWLVGLYGWIWARVVKNVQPACISLERAPLEGVGLALARLLSGLPVINGFVRPVIPVACQLALRPRVDLPGGSIPSEPHA